MNTTIEPTRRIDEETINRLSRTSNDVTDSQVPAAGSG